MVSPYLGSDACVQFVARNWINENWHSASQVVASVVSSIRVYIDRAIIRWTPFSHVKPSWQWQTLHKWVRMTSTTILVMIERVDVTRASDAHSEASNLNLPINVRALQAYAFSHWRSPWWWWSLDMLVITINGESMSRWSHFTFRCTLNLLFDFWWIYRLHIFVNITVDDSTITAAAAEQRQRQ